MIVLCGNSKLNHREMFLVIPSVKMRNYGATLSCENS